MKQAQVESQKEPTESAQQSKKRKVSEITMCQNQRNRQMKEKSHVEQEKSKSIPVPPTSQIKQLLERA